ncbi:GGDEF domain-containing protein [Undibacterium sp. TJN25]|uniref:GGDEF domain-containing protein n=1 Tax=Undibacterium sp. TJN25 TaxID=3413056 RepID=UPI003BEF69BC
MPNQPKQDINDLTTHLTHLVEKIKTGADTGAIIQDLQAALEALSAVSTHDSLTGALNRRGLLQKLDAELDRAKRTGHPFSFAVIGIDQFPVLVERHGKAAGDQILRNLTQAALQLLRSLDSFGRVGESEFAIVLPTTWLDQSGKAIARLTSAVAAVDWAGVVAGLEISFCSGLTTNAHGDTGEDMLQRASEALVQARAKGPGSSVQLEQSLPDFDPNLL